MPDTITPAITVKRSSAGHDGYKVVWTGLTYNASNISGIPFDHISASDRTVQATGTFGAGGHVKMMGSLDGVNYFVLSDPSGADIDLAAAGGSAVLELVQYIKPTVTAGDGTTLLTVTLLAGGHQ